MLTLHLIDIKHNEIKGNVDNIWLSSVNPLERCLKKLLQADGYQMAHVWISAVLKRVFL